MGLPRQHNQQFTLEKVLIKFLDTKENLDLCKKNFFHHQLFSSPFFNMPEADLSLYLLLCKTINFTPCPTKKSLEKVVFYCANHHIEHIWRYSNITYCQESCRILLYDIRYFSCRPQCQFSKRTSTCVTLTIFAFAVLVGKTFYEELVISWFYRWTSIDSLSIELR